MPGDGRRGRVSTVRRPAEVFPPGDFLREELEERGWTQQDLADILGRPPRVVNEIINAKRSITPETAKELSAALGTSPEFWLNLETAYQLWHVRDRDKSDAVARRARLYRIAPIAQMARRGWLALSENLDVLEQRLRDFFGVDVLGEAPPPFLSHAARKSTPYDNLTAAQTAWLFRVRALARTIPASAFQSNALDEVIAQVRALAPAPEALHALPSILAGAGIRFVVIEVLPGTRIDGVCFWMDGAPVIALSLRYDRIDGFWHTLMHELGHIRAGDGLSLDTDIIRPAVPADGDAPPERPEAEQRADSFAVECLVPQQALETFIRQHRPRYAEQQIIQFAGTCQVHPGVVVGQLQFRREIPYSHHRRMLAPVREQLAETALIDGWRTGRRGRS